MPTYEYRCATCGGRFEHFQSIKADALTTCPVEECQADDPSRKGTGEVRRIVSGGAGVVFKGEGFYLTDYARKGGKGETEKGEKGRSESGSSGESQKSSKGETGGTSEGSGSTGKSGKTGSANTSE